MVLVSKVYINISYTYQKHSHDIQLNVRIYRLNIYSKEWHIKKQEDMDIFDLIEEVDISGGTDRFKQVFKDSFKKMKISLATMKRLLAKSWFHQLNWQTTIGTGNASSTGIVIGGIWTLKGMMISYLKEVGNISGNPKIKITPNFQLKQLESKFDCIVSIRIGQAIYTVMKSIRKASQKNEVYS